MIKKYHNHKLQDPWGRVEEKYIEEKRSKIA